MSIQLSGREREARAIHRVKRAAMVGRLMLGEVRSWQQFLEPDILNNVSDLPRKHLKFELEKIKQRLLPEVNKFCSCNFSNMTEYKLSELYEDIKKYRGLEIPLSEFEDKYSPILEDVLIGNPAHATVVISLWGLKFKFPEGELSRDLLSSLQLILETRTELKQYVGEQHSVVKDAQDEISSLNRRESFAVRASILSSFNLLEAYLNGLAWDYVQKNGVEHLSEKRQKEIKDTTFSRKLRIYPEIISGRKFEIDQDEIISGFVETLKPYRDSLVHASPFSVPERFGGYDKLRLFYRVEYDTAIATAKSLVYVLQKAHEHIYQGAHALPAWIQDLDVEVNNFSEKVDELDG